jgi:hypothetical protein
MKQSLQQAIDNLLEEAKTSTNLDQNQEKIKMKSEI